MGIWERFRDRRAVTFVDYEHWFFSLREKFGVKPDVLSWAKEIRKQYDVTKMLFFGNFLQDSLQAEITRVRTVTNDIIETQFGNPGYRIKDMSDFILLDHLYRAAEDKHSPKTFLLFTGDGHFAPAVRHLVQEKKKKVVVYGVRECISHFLREAATECREIPDEQEQLQQCKQFIIIYYDRLFQRYGDAILTFRKVVDTVSQEHNLPAQTVEIALSQMINDGLMVKRRHRSPRGNNINIVSPEWDKLIEAGLYQVKE